MDVRRMVVNLGDSDDDDDSQHVEPVDSGVSATDQRLAEDIAFTQWLEARQTKATAHTSSSDRVSSSSCELEVTESRRIIASPREYQVELFEKAKGQNTIVVLDTGTGKTLIAALLLRHTIDQEYEERRQGNPSRISVFLVDKIALAKQQHRVLKENIDCNIACFAGDTTGEPRTNEFWQRQLEENMVIVCVGAVLQKCLHRSYIKMEQINLLVFDEAHHAKREHPYARIVTDFYAKSEAVRLPRIFGMTASPVDAKTDFDQAASELEGLLHSKIATVGDPSVLRSSVYKAEEHTVNYNTPIDSFDTALCQKLKTLLGSNKAVERLFIYAKLCTSELGPWCADHLWRLALGKDEGGLRRLQARVEDAVHDMAAQNDAMEAAEAAQDIVVAHSFADLASSPLLVSNKVNKLVELLQKSFRPGHDKCVIFVAKRFTAVLLVEVLQNQAMGLPGVTAARMIGTGKSGWGEPSMTILDQELTVQKFHSGKVNVLVATSVAEEGLDIPDCNMVVRFDQCNTMIQYVQSRGRARQASSRLYHFAQVGHSAQRSLLLDIREQENQMRLFCATRPEDRRVDAPGASIEYLLSRRAKERIFTVKSTGAKLTYRVSLELLAEFVHSLPTESTSNRVGPEYVVRAVPSGFRAEVILPDTSPVTTMVGNCESSKQLAKCAAAFDMCKELRGQKCLDEWLRPAFTKQLPAMRNKRLALTSTKVAEYPMQIKPELWSARGFPEELYITIFNLASTDALQRSSAPLAFLTRTPMPRVGNIPLFFTSRQRSTLELVPLEHSIGISKNQVYTLTNFTLRIFQDVFSKTYAAEPEKLPYYLAPLRHDRPLDFSGLDFGSPCDLLDWEQMAFVEARDFVEANQLTHSQLSDRYVVDPHNGARKFYTSHVVPHLKGSDSQIPSAPRSARVTRAMRNAPDDIWNYSVSLWSNSRSKIEPNEQLPVVQAKHINIRRNLLDSTDVVEPFAACYLVLQTLRISALKPDIVATAYTLPAMIFRLESSLIALEACAATGLGTITPTLALPALTKNSDNTGEHDQKQVNFQQGMGENYERLEFLGDSFLKMSTTVALFARAPQISEFFHHVNRMVLINNTNLYEAGLAFGIPRKIRSRAFNRRLWYPDGLVLLQGKKNDSILGSKEVKKTNHTLAAKTIADVCEALIGAAYLTARELDNMDLAVLAVTRFVRAPEHTMEKWEDFYPAYKIPDWQKAKASAAQEALAEKLAGKLRYQFQSPALARCAFTHTSYSNFLEGLPNYQQLEFLGDALLDMACVDHLFQKYPVADPQWLTEHKMAMVSNQFLAFLCVSLDLHRHMQVMDMELQRLIGRYVEAVNQARKDAETKAEAIGLARHEHARDFWVQLPKPPKALSDVVEAYIGAIFVDSKFEFTEVQRFFEAYVLPHFTDMQIYDTFASKQPMTLLISTLQERFRCQRARIMSRTVPKLGGAAKVMDDEGVCAIMIHDAIVQHGVAESERYAKIKAAKEFNKIVEGMDVEEYRKRYSCDCKTT